MSERPAPRSRRRCVGAFGPWLALAAFPAAAQVSPLTYQSLFFNQASNAHAGDYLTANAGLIYTSNAQLTNGGAGDTLALVSLSGAAARTGPRLDFSLDSDIALVKYLGGSFPTEPSGYLDGQITLKIVPGYSWLARATYTQLQLNPYAPITPDNLENVTYLTTGPRFTWRPTLRTTVTLDALYSWMISSSPSPLYADLTNHRYSADLKIERAFSSSSSLYLKGNYQKVDFRNQQENNNYDLASALAGYRFAEERTSVDISGGYSRSQVFNVLTPVQTIIGVVEARQDRTFESPVWAVNLARRITPRQRISLSASQQLQDLAGAGGLGFNAAVPTFAPQLLAQSSPFVSRAFSADWRFDTVRTSFDVGVRDSTQRYQVVQANMPGGEYNTKAASAFAARQLSAVMNWDVGVTWQRQSLSGAALTQYFGGTGASNWVTFQTDLRWQVGERLGLRFIYTHSSAYGISDNQLGVIASYGLLGSSQAALSLVAPPPGLAPMSPASPPSPAPYP